MAGPGADPMMAMMEGLWDMPMVAQIAFHPRPAEAAYMGATSGPIRDGTFDVAEGDNVAYRLYVPPEGTTADVVVYVFHGNAEICTDMDDVVSIFQQRGAAVLSIDYRGYAWSTGQASLKKLCGDSEECFKASRSVLAAAGLGDARCVIMGRSIGATCAVHLASQCADKVHGLIIDSGLMSIKRLPMVSMFGQQMFGLQGAQMLQMVPEPFDTVGKLKAVGCPTLVMHGDMDEIVPYEHGVECHAKCATSQKTMKQWAGAGHNNVHMMFGSAWEAEVAALLALAKDFTIAFPAGTMVEAHSLSTPTFNGLRGRVAGPSGDRITVDFGKEHGEKNLKPVNLQVVDP